jgi:hypothetical protein
MSKFEEAIASAKAGTLNTPSVSYGGNDVDYFWYQLSVHHFNLKLMAKRITFRNVKLSDIKKYYGLKGRTAQDCLAQFESIIAFYRLKMINDNLNSMEL